MFSPELLANLNINFATYFYVLVRLGFALSLTPFFNVFTIPPQIKALLLLGIAATLSLPYLNLTPQHISVQSSSIFLSIVNEAILGASLALGLMVCYASAVIAGRMLDIQIGFGVGQIFDPANSTQLPFLAAVFGQLIVVLFFLTDAHYQFFRGLFLSFEVYPPGKAVLTDASFHQLFVHVKSMFTLGVFLAAPFLVALFLIELVLSIISRNLPQLNMFVLAIPIKLITGIAILSFFIVSMRPAFNKLYLSVFENWENLFLILRD